MPNPSARLQGLLSGRLHVAMVLGPDEISLVESAGHSMSVQPDTSMIVLAFNLARPSPLHDVRVRHALNHAVNKQAIVDGLLAGQSRVSTQTASAVAFGFDPNLKAYEYDPDLARDLLADAGYPDGFTMIAEVLNVTSSFAGPAYQQVVADLARVGVDVELRAIPVPKYALTLLPKSGPGGSSPMRPDRWSYLSWPVPASGSRCSSGTVVGYRRSRCTRIAQPWPRAGYETGYGARVRS